MINKHTLEFVRIRFTVYIGAYCNVVFSAAVSSCHATLVAFMNKPDLFFHRNTCFATTYHNRSSIIVVK